VVWWYLGPACSGQCDREQLGSGRIVIVYIVVYIMDNTYVFTMFRSNAFSVYSYLAKTFNSSEKLLFTVLSTVMYKPVS